MNPSNTTTRAGNTAKALLTAAILTTSAIAQTPSLAFTPSGPERSRSGSKGTSCRTITPDDIAVVTPTKAIMHSAENWLKDWNLQTMAGDTVGGGRVHHPDLTGGINVVLTMPYEWDPVRRRTRTRPKPLNARDAYITPKVAVGTSVSGSPGLRRGDIGRFVPDGRVAYFIRAEQIIQSLGMIVSPINPVRLNPKLLKLDAAAVSMGRHIYLSFATSHWLRLWRGGSLVNHYVRDGAIVCIPGPAWFPNANGEVGTVIPNRAIVLFTEAEVDTLVKGSYVSNHKSAQVTTIGDTTGLAVDYGATNRLRRSWGGAVFTLDHLMYSGTTLTGCGVLSTSGGIAVMSGCALAASPPTPTCGRRVGLKYIPCASSFAENLSYLKKEPCYFTLSTPDPLVTKGGAFQVDVGTNLNPTAVFLLFGFGELPVSSAIPATSLGVVGPWFANNRCFPHAQRSLWPPALGGSSILPSLFYVPVATTAAWGGQFGGVSGVGTPPAIGFQFQAIAVDAAGNFHLSTPGTIN